MKTILPLGKLNIVMPYAARSGRVLRFHQPLNVILVEYDITTKLRIAAFLSQIAVESGEFKYVREIWGPSSQQIKYEPPFALSIRLGNTQPGDGVRYMGRGLIQITGRANYHACSEGLGVDFVAYPELLEESFFACRSAGWYWQHRNINAAADRGDIKAVTRLVNGGTTALAERTMYYKRALA